MERLSNDKILRYRPGVVEAVRRSVNLASPGRMDEAVDILEEWVKRQPHIVKKNFSRHYLEITLIMAKGLVERAKQRIDKLCTFKTLMPEYFVMASDAKQEFNRLATVIPTVYLPMPCEDHYRVIMCRLNTDDYDTDDVLSFYKYVIAFAEYTKKNDYLVGAVSVIDLRGRNLLNLIPHMNLVLLRRIVTILLDGYGLRLKGIYILTESKVVGTLISMVKPMLSAKIFGRIHVLPDAEALYEFIPREVLPVEYGGQEKPLEVICDNWIEALTAPDFLDYFKEMAKATTNETFRRSDKFNQDYAGMPGSFRTLIVD